MIHKSSSFLLLTIFLISNTLFAQTTISVDPPPLKKGDTVMIVAPAGVMKDTIGVYKAIELLHKWGLHYKLGKHLFAKHYQFAGTDTERLSDFQAALDDPSVKAIWCARGGYGTIKILDDVDFTNFIKNPKWIIGFSDITAFHTKLNNLGITTIHGIMPLTYKPNKKEQKRAIKSLQKAFFGKRLKYKVAESKYNREGKAEGVVVGGNLSLVYSMLGSDTQLNTDEKILYLEEVGEALYHIDRMMISLKRAGTFDNCKGLIIGGFSDLKSEANDFGMTYEEIILDAVKNFDFPVAFDFPAGHITDNRTVLLGRNVYLEVKKNKTKLKFDK